MTNRFAITLAVVAGLGFSAVPFMAHAETLQESLLAGIEKSDNLMASRQNYVAARQQIGIAGAGNDLSGTVTITGAQTESDSKHKSGGFASSQSFSTRIAISKQLYDSGEIDARTAVADYGIASASASRSFQSEK